MKMYFLWICILTPIFSFNAKIDAEEKAITIVIPAYNTKQWCYATLNSVLEQEYTHFKIIYIDDASTDGSGDLVKHYLQKYDPDQRVTFIQNDHRVGALANLFSGIWMCSPSEIIVTLDGDDSLAHPQVLQTINHIYDDPDIWMTYGQFIEYPTGRMGGAAPIPEHIIDANCFREYDWVTTHLRTFYAELFQKITIEDLLYEDRFFSVTWDLAFMFPILEMAGRRSRFIPEILYVYNVENPLNDLKQHRDLQFFLEQIIRSRSRYQPQPFLFHRLSQ